MIATDTTSQPWHQRSGQQLRWPLLKQTDEPDIIRNCGVGGSCAIHKRQRKQGAGSRQWVPGMTVGEVTLVALASGSVPTLRTRKHRCGHQHANQQSKRFFILLIPNWAWELRG